MVQDRRYERMSDVYMREKSPETKREEAQRHLDKIFSGNTELSVTSSSNNNSRVRAHIPDEDGYAVWIEDSSHVGIVKIDMEDGTTKYLAERHFPHKSDKPTYLWEFTPEDGKLLITRQDGDGEEPQFDMPVVADADHEGYFLRLTQDMVGAWSFDDWENRFSSEKYNFLLDDLK